jgi:hypothetical protein
MSIKYLNPMGLLMMSEFISVPRKHKGLNIDDFRKRLLLKAVNSIDSITPFDAYKQTLDVYFNIFNASDYIDKYMLQTLLQHMIQFTNVNIVEHIEKMFIPVIRPYINSFLRDFEIELMSLYKEDAFIALVGGDAMRRYDINISNTLDFDTKLYTNTKVLRGKQIENLIIFQLSRFVTFLNGDRVRFLTGKHQVYEINIIENFQVKIKMLTNEGQFRLRYIKKNASLPVDLFSLDYRAKVEIQYRSATINMNIDVPFLDIVVIANGNDKTKHSKNDVVDIEKSRVVPVATLDFLVGDLEKTYTTPNLAAARYWNDKNTKDINRYRILQNVKHYNKHGNGDVMEIESGEILDAVVEDTIWDNITNSENTKRGHQYADAFKNMMEKSKQYKYKMNFSDLTEDNDIDFYNESDESQLTTATDMEID